MHKPGLIYARFTYSRAKRLFVIFLYYSAFHLSYNMLLNQMRCEESDPEALLRNSFYQFQCDRALPQLQVFLELKFVLMTPKYIFSLVRCFMCKKIKNIPPMG